MTTRTVLPSDGAWGQPISAVSQNTTYVTTAASRTLIAFAGYYGPTSNPAIASITSSGLVWTAFASGSFSDGSGSFNCMKLWWTYATAALNSQYIECNAAEAHNFGFAVYSMKNVHPTSPIGAITSGTMNVAGTASFTLTGTHDGSMVFLNAVKTVGISSTPGSGTKFIGSASIADQNWAVLSEMGVSSTLGSSVTLRDSVGTVSTLEWWGYYQYELLPNNVGFSSVEIAEDPVGTPRGGTTTNDTTISTYGPRVLVATHAFSSVNNCKVNSMTGGGLTWLSSSVAQWPGNNTFGTEVWYAIATSSLNNVAITSTLNSSNNYAFKVIPLWACNSTTPVGQRVPQQFINNSVLLSATLTGCQSGSMIVAAGWTNGAGGGPTLTLATGTSLIDWQNNAGLFIRSTSGTISGTNTISASMNVTPSEQYMAAAEFLFGPQTSPYLNQGYFQIKSSGVVTNQKAIPTAHQTPTGTPWQKSSPTFGLGKPTAVTGSSLYYSTGLPSYDSSTVCGWFYYIAGASDYRVIVGFGNSGGATTILNTSPGVDTYALYDNVSAVWSSNIATLTTGWYFFAMTSNAGTVTGYIVPTGTQVTTGQTATISTGRTMASINFGDWGIMSNQYPPAGYWARCRAWGSVLSVADLNAERVSPMAVKAGALFDASLEGVTNLGGLQMYGSLISGP